MPNYKVKLGYGLHFGWAIEVCKNKIKDKIKKLYLFLKGAIGSSFKIDASYLSPNVNIASRLEAATKQYGTPLLIRFQLNNLYTFFYFQKSSILNILLNMNN